MTYRQWEWELKCLLRGVPKKEVDAATSYYREIYNDKKEAGFSDIDILIEFGSPEECAERIREEGSSEAKSSEGIAEDAKALWNKGVAWLRDISYSGVGLAVISILLVIPALAVAVSLIAAFGAAMISGAAVSVGGVAAIVWSVVELISGAGVTTVLAMFGMGVASIGLGVVVAIVFFFLTKYSCIATYRALKLVYKT